MRPRLLDLFCGAGGAAVGYARAGFDVVGVDIEPQPNYPFRFVQADALDAVESWIDGGHWFWEIGEVEAVHASPPCQAYSKITNRSRGRGGVDDHRVKHADLLAPTRERLAATGLPYVIENVPGAPLVDPVVICGSSVGLDVRRHRLFETNWPLLVPPCAHGVHWPRFRSLDTRQVARGSLASVVGVHGHLNYAGEGELRRAAMGVDWMTDGELAEAIPPLYTELVGLQLAQQVSLVR